MKQNTGDPHMAAGPFLRIEKKFCKKLQKMLALFLVSVYNRKCCGMIAMKRRLPQALKGAAGYFVERMSIIMTTSHCTKNSLP